ncbi:unnamed protein product [Amoebophrya sp. A120]|nr:unnamed protein product [Amoebophrya sp. A120]|eukprot:GSA120T00022391001.1
MKTIVEDETNTKSSSKSRKKSKKRNRSSSSPGRKKKRTRSRSPKAAKRKKNKKKEKSGSSSSSASSSASDGNDDAKPAAGKAKQEVQNTTLTASQTQYPHYAEGSHENQDLKAADVVRAAILKKQTTSSSSSSIRGEAVAVEVGTNDKKDGDLDSNSVHAPLLFYPEQHQSSQQQLPSSRGVSTRPSALRAAVSLADPRKGEFDDSIRTMASQPLPFHDETDFALADMDLFKQANDAKGVLKNNKDWNTMNLAGASTSRMKNVRFDNASQQKNLEKSIQQVVLDEAQKKENATDTELTNLIRAVIDVNEDAVYGVDSHDLKRDVLLNISQQNTKRNPLLNFLKDQEEGKIAREGAEDQDGSKKKKKKKRDSELDDFEIGERQEDFDLADGLPDNDKATKGGKKDMYGMGDKTYRTQREYEHGQLLRKIQNRSRIPLSSIHEMMLNVRKSVLKSSLLQPFVGNLRFLFPYSKFVKSSDHMPLLKQLCNEAERTGIKYYKQFSEMLFEDEQAVIYAIHRNFDDIFTEEENQDSVKLFNLQVYAFAKKEGQPGILPEKDRKKKPEKNWVEYLRKGAPKDMAEKQIDYGREKLYLNQDPSEFKYRPDAIVRLASAFHLSLSSALKNAYANNHSAILRGTIRGVLDIVSDEVTALLLDAELLEDVVKEVRLRYGAVLNIEPFNYDIFSANMILSVLIVIGREVIQKHFEQHLLKVVSLANQTTKGGKSPNPDFVTESEVMSMLLETPVYSRNTADFDKLHGGNKGAVKIMGLLPPTVCGVDLVRVWKHLLFLFDKQVEGTTGKQFDHMNYRLYHGLKEFKHVPIVPGVEELEELMQKVEFACAASMNLRTSNLIMARKQVAKAMTEHDANYQYFSMMRSNLQDMRERHLIPQADAISFIKFMPLSMKLELQLILQNALMFTRMIESQLLILHPHTLPGGLSSSVGTGQGNKPAYQLGPEEDQDRVNRFQTAPFVSDPGRLDYAGDSKPGTLTYSGPGKNKKQEADMSPTRLLHRRQAHDHRIMQKGTFEHDTIPAWRGLTPRDHVAKDIFHYSNRRENAGERILFDPMITPSPAEKLMKPWSPTDEDDAHGMLAHADPQLTMSHPTMMMGNDVHDTSKLKEWNDEVPATQQHNHLSGLHSVRAGRTSGDLVLYSSIEASGSPLLHFLEADEREKLSSNKLGIALQIASNGKIRYDPKKV